MREVEYRLCALDASDMGGTMPFEGALMGFADGTLVDHYSWVAYERHQAGLAVLDAYCAPILENDPGVGD